MNVESWLKATIAGYPWDKDVLEYAALSPIFARPTPLQSLPLNAKIEDNSDDECFVKSLQYAVSTMFYSASGVLSGGSRSEQVGDIRSSIGGVIVTQADREYWRKKADNLRLALGCDIEDNFHDQGGMFNADILRH